MAEGTCRGRSFIGSRYRPVAWIAVVSVAIGLGACASILPKTPDAIYDLTAPENVTTRAGTRTQILVPEPSALKSLDTERIAARPSNNELAYLPSAAWSDRLPRLLQTRLMETLQNTGRVGAVAVPGQGLLIDYQVIMDVRAFEVAHEEAVVSIHVKLMNDRDGRVRATRIFNGRTIVTGVENLDYVVALNASMDAVFSEMTDWILSRI
jgi:cholesterol transport system auxiliary component